MVRAGEAIRFTGSSFTDTGTAMATPIQQRVDLAFPVASNDDRLPTDMSRLEATGARDLALVSNPHPGLLEDFLHLHVENIRIGVHPSGNPIRRYEIRRCEFVDVVRCEFDGHVLYSKKSKVGHSRQNR